MYKPMSETFATTSLSVVCNRVHRKGLKDKSLMIGLLLSEKLSQNLITPKVLVTSKSEERKEEIKMVYTQSLLSRLYYPDDCQVLSVF